MKKFEGSEKQIKWAKDAYSRYATVAKKAISEQRDFIDNNDTKILKEAIILATNTRTKVIKDIESMNVFLDDMLAEIESMTTQDWINFDDAMSYSKKQGEDNTIMLTLYSIIFKKIK